MPSYGVEKKKQAKARRVQAQKELNDIGEIPAVKDPERRRACEADPALWLRTYHPEHFYLDFSESQRDCIELTWNAIERRGYQNVNAYRSFGKTTLFSGLMERALLMGVTRYGIYISAVDSMSADAANFFAVNLQADTLTEDGEWEPEFPLAQDYPEVCYPLACRGGIAQRPLEYQGRRCEIEVKPDRLRFPTIVGSRCNASLLLFTSIWSGNIRGKRHQIPTEGTFRPDVAMLDDVQSDGTSKSEVQVNSIFETIKKSVEGLAGYDRRTGRKEAITILSALTQNQPDDVAVRLADRPEYCTKIYRFLRRTPADFAPWREYRDFWSDTWRRLGRKEAVIPALAEYYNAHRTALEYGVEADNPLIYEEGDVSAVHYALNFWCRSETAFWCELQNDAQRAKEETGGTLTPIVVQRKQLVPAGESRPLRRCHVPANTELMTAFIDCGEHYLNYEVTAFGANYEFAHVVDFGVWPEQNYPVTKKRSFRVDLQDAYSEGDKFDKLGAAVKDCLRHIFEQTYFDADGEPFDPLKQGFFEQHAHFPGKFRKTFSTLAICGVDCSDGEMEFALWKAIDEFHRFDSGRYAGLAIPCYGDEAQSRLMRYYDLKPGEWRRGRKDAAVCDWIENPTRSQPLMRQFANIYASLLYDSNTYKSRRDQAWMTDADRPGALTLFDWTEPDYLRMFAEHQCAEEWIEGWKNNLRYQRWRMKRPRVSDNEFLDTDTGCWALASYVGLEYPANTSQNKRLKVTWKRNTGND